MPPPVVLLDLPSIQHRPLKTRGIVDRRRQMTSLLDPADGVGLAPLLGQLGSVFLGGSGSGVGYSEGGGGFGFPETGGGERGKREEGKQRAEVDKNREVESVSVRRCMEEQDDRRVKRDWTNRRLPSSEADMINVEVGVYATSKTLHQKKGSDQLRLTPVYAQRDYKEFESTNLCILLVW